MKRDTEETARARAMIDVARVCVCLECDDLVFSGQATICIKVNATVYTRTDTHKLHNHLISHYRYRTPLPTPLTHSHSILLALQRLKRDLPTTPPHLPPQQPNQGGHGGTEDDEDDDPAEAAEPSARRSPTIKERRVSAVQKRQEGGRRERDRTGWYLPGLIRHQNRINRQHTPSRRQPHRPHSPPHAYPRSCLARRRRPIILL